MSCEASLLEKEIEAFNLSQQHEAANHASVQQSTEKQRSAEKQRRDASWKHPAVIGLAAVTDSLGGRSTRLQRIGAIMLVLLAMVVFGSLLSFLHWRAVCRHYVDDEATDQEVDDFSVKDSESEGSSSAEEGDHEEVFARLEGRKAISKKGVDLSSKTQEQRPRWSAEAVAQTLANHGLCAQAFHSQVLDGLASELTRGAASLYYALRLLLSVNVVQVLLHDTKSKMVLQEFAYQKKSRQSVLENSCRVPGPKGQLLEGETLQQCVERLLFETIGFKATDAPVTCKLLRVVEAEEASDSFPGLTSVVRRFVVQADFEASAPLRKKFAIDAGRLHRVYEVYRWRPAEKVPSIKRANRKQSLNFGRYLPDTAKPVTLPEMTPEIPNTAKPVSLPEMTPEMAS